MPVLLDETMIAAQNTEPEQLFTESLKSLLQSAGIPGLSVAVVKNTKVVYADGFGYADLERKIPATPDTAYDVASVTKPISAVAILKLVQNGTLDLDQPLAEYTTWQSFAQKFSQQPSLFARGLGNDFTKQTLRHLLSHTATVPVGETFSYNPILFSWASRAAMAATGIPFSTLVERSIFTPAGMNGSARKHRNLPLSAAVSEASALAYLVKDGGEYERAPGLEPQGDGAAGGVVSTVLDLSKFDAALDNGALLSSELRQHMMTPTQSSNGTVFPYGLGWFLQEYQNHNLVWHAGWWPDAYSALYLKLPEKGLTLILLANSEGLWWGNPLTKAEVEKSPFAQAFLHIWARVDTPLPP